MSGLLPLDPDFVADVLSKDPFITIDGVFNVRDLGLIPAQDGEHVTRSGFMYRSGELSGVTQNGKNHSGRAAAALGITTIFDLRSDTEIAKYNAATPQLTGVTILHTPVFAKEDYSPERMAQRFQLYASGKTEAFMQLYSEILDAGGPAFGAILRHVRDAPNDSFIFHCTAGKDRTGIAAALLLLLAGASPDVISTDYALTRIGREPMRPLILSRLAREPLFASDPTAAHNMLSSREETMHAFIRMLNERYGGVEEYARRVCDLTDQDIAIIRRNLVAPKP
ncbi:protein-tyrosine phosphatase-like protein [Multifurca ochricompacta]|uniref:Protein-tyrosine phosphatase-like protein n=1 Tax=Multifurca ochricompacta TaxID=376703 RepID=A0AAD4LUX3_9AGAM|nr:protein-tyrosine phosphatase-like protein [Multifurca ochricompacta]